MRALVTIGDVELFPGTLTLLEGLREELQQEMLLWVWACMKAEVEFSMLHPSLMVGGSWGGEDVIFIELKPLILEDDWRRRVEMEADRVEMLRSMVIEHNVAIVAGFAVTDSRQVPQRALQVCDLVLRLGPIQGEVEVIKSRDGAKNQLQTLTPEEVF